MKYLKKKKKKEKEKKKKKKANHGDARNFPATVMGPTTYAYPHIPTEVYAGYLGRPE